MVIKKQKALKSPESPPAVPAAQKQKKAKQADGLAARFLCLCDSDPSTRRANHRHHDHPTPHQYLWIKTTF
jgi:hypothetical protein